MPTSKPVEIVDVNRGNVDQTGFFCCMSKRTSTGYQRKLKWLKDRFAEGMRLKLLGGGKRGFIEYLPGEYAWRGVQAKGYLFVHCLWVVGRSKGQGFGSQLLRECIEDARASGMKGVAMVTSKDNWLTGAKLLAKHGFESVAKAPPNYDLMVLRFGRSRLPKFCGDWEANCRSCGQGLTVFRTNQCPYLDDAVNTLIEAAERRDTKIRIVELEDAKSIRERAPCPYGTFGVVQDGRLLSHCYLSRKEIDAKWTH